MTVKISGQIVDIFKRVIYPGTLHIKNGRIDRIQPEKEAQQRFILPGFIDAHIHIESSMLVPYEFARMALRHGTVATVSDPHEIANVLGLEGVEYMLTNARNALLKFHFGAPSCVPATQFETAGAYLNIEEVQSLLARKDIFYLSEMMNYPGVINRDPEVMGKIAAAKKAGKPVDGHAPGVRGEKVQSYIAAGITTDHECFTLAEALEKLALGMKIIIREGSAAKNYQALHPLIAMHPDQVMFCSDDKHPDDLIQGHINELVVRSLELGYDLFDVLQIACVNPIDHYTLTSGLLNDDDPADFIIVEDLNNFKIISTYINGIEVATCQKCILENRSHEIINQFRVKEKNPRDFKIKSKGNPQPVIIAVDGELITEKDFFQLPESGEFLISDLENDILKIAVINRYVDRPVAIGYVKNFGLKKGAIASTVAHDSHNIIAVGVDDECLARVVNLLIKTKGGLAAVSDNKNELLPLPIAGLMSDKSCEEVGGVYASIDAFVKSLGSELTAPFMTLSFMALLVIPKIKISDQGMFDAEAFVFYE